MPPTPENASAAYKIQIRTIAEVYYGGLELTDGSTAQTGVDATPAVMTGWAANSDANDVVPDHTTDTITITTAGVYYINAQVSFSGTVNAQITAERAFLTISRQGKDAGPPPCDVRVQSVNTGGTYPRVFVVVEEIGP